ncbi:unnamed protein product [Merluccius merluccius]
MSAEDVPRGVRGGSGGRWLADGGMGCVGLAPTTGEAQHVAHSLPMACQSRYKVAKKAILDQMGSSPKDHHPLLRQAKLGEDHPFILSRRILSSPLKRGVHHPLKVLPSGQQDTILSACWPIPSARTDATGSRGCRAPNHTGLLKHLDRSARSAAALSPGMSPDEAMMLSIKTHPSLAFSQHLTPPPLDLKDPSDLH